MRIYLMRHGETDWNVDRRLQGSADIPLNENGRELARRTAVGMAGLPLDEVLCSPLSRARETAELIAAPHGLTPITVDELREMCFGEYEGKSSRYIPELKTLFEQPEQFVPVGGESFDELDARCRRVLDTLASLEGEREQVLVVAHGATLKGLLRVILHRTVAEFWSGPPQGNCTVTTVDCTDGVFTVLEYGRAWLPEEEAT